MGNERKQGKRIHASSVQMSFLLPMIPRTVRKLESAWEMRENKAKEYMQVVYR